MTQTLETDTVRLSETQQEGLSASKPGVAIEKSLSSASFPSLSKDKLAELFSEEIKRTEVNRNVLAVVTGNPRDKLSSVTIPIFSEPAKCGDPQAVIGLGIATKLESSEVREILREVRQLEAVKGADDNANVSYPSIKKLFKTFLKNSSVTLDLGVFAENATAEYQRRLEPKKFGVDILTAKIVEKGLSNDRKLLSVPARFSHNRIDTNELMEFTKEKLKHEEMPTVLHLPILRTAVTHDQAIRLSNVYIIFGGGNIAILHDADEVANALQYGNDPVEQVISRNLSQGLTEVDPLTVVVDLLKSIDAVHFETLNLIESRLKEVVNQQRLDDGRIKGVKTINEVNRLAASLNEAQREILHARRTTSNLLASCSAPDFINTYGDSKTIIRNRSYISGLMDRLAQDQELVTGMQHEIESMHNTHSARESISSHKARNMATLAAVWATPLMGAHYAATAAAEHGLKLNGHLAVISLVGSGLVSLWFYRKQIFGLGE
jgi:hypothetical protein